MSTRPTLIAAGPERRSLAVVAFLDVVNYTAMMAEQEARTHALWMSLLEELIHPSIAEHDGVAVKSLGDGVLARFGSALHAVEWADRLQQATRARQASLEQVMPYIELRISIHVGEIILTPIDVFGECVNFAARILEHASPGGVVMSQAIYDMVRTSAGARAKDIGLHKLKSYDRPVRLYQLEPEAPSRRKTPASSVPSIAILPLTDVGPNSPDGYFAEGVVEDVVVSLAGLGDMLVVSRGSTLGFRGVDADPREVGRVLGVQYVVSGTLQRRPNLIRVSWQLCATDSGIALWTETAEAAPDDLFELQDRIVARIVAGIAPKVRASELRRIMRKRPESFNAYDHMLRGLHLMHRLELGDHHSAYECFEAAMTEDPSFGMPFAWAAFSQVLSVGQGVAADPGAAIEKAGNLASRAIELDGSNALALAIYGHVKSYLLHQYEIGLQYLDRALAAGPSNPSAWTFSALSLAYTGHCEQAVTHARHALRLSPLDQNIFFFHSNLCLAHYGAGDFAEAARWGRLCLEENPRFSANMRLLAASLVGLGAVEEAKAVAAQMLSIEPQFSVAKWSRTLQPFRDPAIARLYAERLLQAGLPP
jgi:adenylate cyclase